MEIVPPDQWDQALPDSADAYWSRAYVEASALLEAGSPLLVRNTSAVMAVILRRIPGSNLLDAITPYGYGGPIGTDGNPVDPRFWRDWDQWCRNHGVVSTFVRFHPLMENHYDCPDASVTSETVAWRTPQESNLLGSMHPKHRNKARQAQAAGVEVVITRPVDDLSEFAELYEQTMRRLHAAPVYHFPQAYWERLLRTDLLLAEARCQGETIAGALCLRGPVWLHYHLSASNNMARRCGAATLLLLRVAEWAQAAGLEGIHLGGGVSGRAGTLLRFKRRFAPWGAPCLFATGRIVHDQSAYKQLCEGRLQSSIFPAYRATPGFHPLRTFASRDHD